ncbi:MAG: DNA-deoxyinosine glycosylase [Lysobacter sp.]
MPTLQGLPPIASADACVLILGSMPGAASLQAGQYYAHRQNRFWPYMGALIGADPALPYAQRVQRLGEAGIAVWDVIANCRREGSLDSAIRDETVNDFNEFFARHPHVGSVLFNGAKAEASFARRVLPTLAFTGLICRRLPSTSPANASQNDPAKLAAWRAALLDAGARLADR